MVYSASAVLAYQKFEGDSFYFAKRQLMWAVLGVISMFIMMNYEYHKLKRVAKPLLIICFLFLIAVVIPGIGSVRGGSRAWLGIGSFGIQPSEFAKLGLIIFFAYYLEKHQGRIAEFRRGLLPPLALVTAAVGLIMLEPDLGQSTVLMGTVIIIIFAAGAKVKHLLGLASLAIPVFVALVAVAPYRLKRIFAFLDPWSFPLDAGYHIIQSLYAIGPGGLLGLGLGRSRQKFLYLPEPQTDFVFSILAEELGFIGGATVLLLFLLLVWRAAHRDHGTGHVRFLARRRNHRHDRRAGDHKHWCRHRFDAGHRDHVAFHQLWRLLVDLDADRGGDLVEHLPADEVTHH